MPNNALNGRVISPISKPVLLAGAITLPAAVQALKVVQDITYTAVNYGTSGNSITITYTAGATAGAEVVTVSGNDISIQIETGVSTATQVKAAFDLSAAAVALASAAITGTAGTAQVAATVVSLATGAGDGADLPDFVSSCLPTSVAGQYSLVLADKYVKGLFFNSSIHVDDASTSSVIAKVELMNADNFSSDVASGTAIELHAIDFAGAEAVVSAASRLHILIVASDSSRG